MATKKTDAKPKTRQPETSWSDEDAKTLVGLFGGKITAARVKALATTLDTSPGAVRNMLAAAHAYKRDWMTPTAKPASRLRIHSDLADRTRALIASAGQTESKPVKRSHHKAKSPAAPVAEPVTEVPTESETALMGHVPGAGMEGVA
jgi:hypothetical protein